MDTLIIHHDDCLLHDPGPGHPESPQRLRAVLAALKDIGGLQWLPAPLATAEQIERVHPAEFWAQLRALEPDQGQATIDADTFISHGSIDATLRGSGGVCYAIDEVLDGRALRAFCAVRPPGHHSGPDRAMGFCLLNHVAIGAMHALSREGVRRIAIIDFDVHHGNGTQAVFEANPDVMYVSSHQSPLYPGTGHIDETGCGNILNLPLPPGAGRRAFRQVWRSYGLPAVRSFAPDLVLVSAGFDAHKRDPLAQLELSAEDFRWITAEICQLATASCAGRVVSLLEGGYDLRALANSARAHVEGLNC